MQTWLPVALFGVDIVLGLPASFIVVSGYHVLRLRHMRTTRTVRRDQENILRRSAVRLYTDYLADLCEYNRLTAQRGMEGRMLVPPCAELRDFLIADFGHDPTRADGNPGADESRGPVRPGPVSSGPIGH